MAKEIAGYYSTSDVMAILSVSRTKALEIFHEFERHGKLMKFGPKTLRIESKEFGKWLDAHKAR